MFLLWEIPRGGCHYPLTDEPTHMFCGEPVTEMLFEGEMRPSSYCKTHHHICYLRRGKSWQGLAGMMNAIEETVIPTPRTPADVQMPLDEVVRAEAKG